MPQTSRPTGGSVAQLVLGGLAGFTATAPMTGVMELLHRQLPAHEQYPLPPREITQEVTDKAGVSHHLDEHQHRQLSLAAHFAYGTFLGAGYVPVAALPGSAAVKGAAYGLAVWAANYLGLLPGAGILRPATEHPPRRTALMIAAHLVWGAAAATFIESLAGPRRRPGARRQPCIETFRTGKNPPAFQAGQGRQPG